MCIFSFGLLTMYVHISLLTAHVVAPLAHYSNIMYGEVWARTTTKYLDNTRKQIRTS